jgi:hypothetical protein
MRRLRPRPPLLDRRALGGDLPEFVHNRVRMQEEHLLDRAASALFEQ